MNSNTWDIGLQAPYAVYGTLRSGEGNASLWRDRARSIGIGSVEGFRLVTNGGFPYALPAEGEVSVVEIIVPVMAEAEILRLYLDRLEGYPSFYDRQVVEVVFGDQLVTAWMYVPNHAEDYARLPRVEGNDWVEAMREEREEAWLTS